MLITCQECGREISDTVKQCPHCGAKIKKSKDEKEGNQQGNKFKKIAEGVSGSVKSMRIYIGALIVSCAIALCFSVILILSFATPYAFLHSEPCKDGYALIDDLIRRSNRSQYETNIQGDNYYISRGNTDSGIMVCVRSYVLGSEGQVQYYFEKNGNVEAVAFYNRYQCTYEYEGTEAIFSKASINNTYVSLTSSERRLADSSINLVETVFDCVLVSNLKDYKFDDILEDYGNYKISINGIRISSIILTSIFMAVSVCGIVFYVKYLKNKKQAATPQENKISDNAIVNEVNDNAIVNENSKVNEVNEEVDLQEVKFNQKSPYYYCDCCKRKIADLSEAALQWRQPINNDDNLGNSVGEFKIVHRKCVEDVPALSDMDFGDNYENVVMRILELLSDNCVANPEEAYEVLKRLTITDYEIVRSYYDLAVSDEVIEPNSKEKYPGCNQISAIKKHYIDRK